MLYQLKNLSQEEQSIVLKSPIWVTLLIACSDFDIEEAEIDRAKEIMHIKTFTTSNDVQEVYKNLSENMDADIDTTLKTLSANGDERIEFITKNLSELNKILPKLDKTFAKQLYNSLKSLAFNVAKSDGGFFGIASISDQEEVLVKLPMIDKP